MGGNVMNSQLSYGITYLFAFPHSLLEHNGIVFSFIFMAGTMEGRESFTCVYRAPWCTKWKFL